MLSVTGTIIYEKCAKLQLWYKNTLNGKVFQPIIYCTEIVAFLKKKKKAISTRQASDKQCNYCTTASYSVCTRY